MNVQPSKWERLLDLRPVPILDHLIDEAARLFAADLARWPPILESTATDEEPIPDGRAAARALEQRQSAAIHFDSSAGRPDDRLYREAFRLAKLDLERRLEEFDFYVRNQGWRQVGLVIEDKPMILFLCRYIVEQALSLSEATEGRVARRHFGELVDRTEHHFNLKATP
jgi:hypothetical protein